MILTPTADNLDPRTCPSQGVIACTYARWFQRPSWAFVKTTPLHLSLPPTILRLFIRFRAGCSGLPIDTGRRQHVPHAQRHCSKCASPSVCDECHLIFECPALTPLRVQFSSLFTPATQCMLGFMWQKDMCAVAMFCGSRFGLHGGHPSLIGVQDFYSAAAPLGPVLAYTHPPGGQSSPNLSAGSSIARQLLWLDSRNNGDWLLGHLGPTAGLGCLWWRCLGHFPRHVSLPWVWLFLAWISVLYL